jgi:hypothetical protein
MPEQMGKRKGAGRKPNDYAVADGQLLGTCLGAQDPMIGFLAELVGA